MIKLPFVQHKSSSCTECILEGSNVNRTLTVNNIVAVINSTCNKRVHHCLRCIFCERPAHCPHLLQMIETFARQTPDVRSKGQLTVKQDSQTHGFSEYLNVSASHCDLLALNLGQLQTGAKPDELRFVFVKFQAVNTHPLTDLIHTSPTVEL